MESLVDTVHAYTIAHPELRPDILLATPRSSPNWSSP
jgi:hypothetical protein